MTDEVQDERSETPPVDPDSAVNLRGDPPRVMRLSRKAIGIASACGFALVGGALIYALQPAERKGAEELYNTDGVAVADNLSGAPKDYGQVPKLGAPLPGDLGKPILDAQRRGDVADLPPIGTGSPAAPVDPAVAAADAARQRAEQEREAARWIAGKWQCGPCRCADSRRSIGCNTCGAAAVRGRAKASLPRTCERPAHRI
jgi:type IV secretion system protein TrbI